MRNRYNSLFSVIGIAILLTTHAGSLIAQHVNTRSAPFGASADRQSGDTLMVPPGFSFSASYYCWIDEAPGSGTTTTADIVLETPVSWVESLTFPAGQTSTDCESPFPVTVRINAPVVAGVYTANVIDLTMEWDPFLIILKVAEIPTSIDFVFTDTLLVGEAGQIQATADASTGITGIACPLLPYYPTSEILYEYLFHPPAPWIGITPDSLVVPAGTNEYPIVDILSPVDGYFTTYRYRGASWYYWPQVQRYDFLFLLSTEVPASPGLPGVGGMLLYPNPAQNVLNIEVDADRALEGWLVLSDALGREALRSFVRFGSGRSVEPVDVSHLADGAYSCMLVVPGSGSTLSGRVIVAHGR